MKRKRLRIQKHAAIRTFRHAAHNFADFAESANNYHHLAGSFQRDLLFQAKPGHNKYKRQTNRDPNKMCSSKHIVLLVFNFNFQMLEPIRARHSEFAKMRDNYTSKAGTKQ